MTVTLLRYNVFGLAKLNLKNKCQYKVKENKMKEMKMRSLSVFLLILMLISFVTIASSQTTLAQEEPVAPSTPSLDSSSSPQHILLGEDDFSEIGKAIAVIEPAWVEQKQDDIPAPGLLSDWTEAAAITLLVQFREDEADNDNTANNAIVNMSSYQFSSEKNAHNQLETINTTLAQENIHLLSEAVSLDDEALDLLSERSTSWHIQIGRDDENLLAYFLWIQWDNYVSETYIAVEEDNEQIAEKLLHHIIQQIFTKDAFRIDETTVWCC